MSGPAPEPRLPAGLKSVETELHWAENNRLTCEVVWLPFMLNLRLCGPL